MRWMMWAIVCGAAWGSGQAWAEEFTVPVGQRQLFLDDHGIEKIKNLKRTMHQPRKLGAVIRPRYIATKEQSIQTRSGPQWDAQRGVYRIWLISADCYESRDGLHWAPTSRKPNRAVISAVIDPDDPDPARRYKGLVSGGGVRKPVVSPDGLDWKFLDVPPIPSQDESNLSYDEITKTFIATVKHSGPFGRTVWLSTSKDFRAWTKPELIFHPDQRDQERAKDVIGWRLANKSLQPMFQNHPKVYNVQVYNMGAFRYEGLYVGLPAMFHSTGRIPNYPNTDGFHVIQLVCSRDLKTWRRLGEREIFIGPSPLGAGAFDLTQILPPSRPIVRGNELWFYYTGIKYRGNYRFEGKYPKGKLVRLPGYEGPTGAICLAVLRRDGFVSLDSGPSSGHLQTQAFLMPAGTLHVNANLKPKGQLVIEAVAGDGQVIATSTPVTGDQPSVGVAWKTPAKPDLAGKRVALRFQVNRGSLYSYWISKKK